MWAKSGITADMPGSASAVEIWWEARARRPAREGRRCDLAGSVRQLLPFAHRSIFSSRISARLTSTHRQSPNNLLRNTKKIN
jgi:hypothetical protein